MISAKEDDFDLLLPILARGWVEEGSRGLDSSPEYSGSIM